MRKSQSDDRDARRSPARVVGRLLGQAERQHEQGDKGALLRALDLCAYAGLPLPSWAAAAFNNAYTSVKHHYGHVSWDEVFGPPHPKHVKLPAKRAQLKKQWRVWLRVVEQRRENPHRDVFHDVAGEFGISVGKAKDYFYAADRLYHSTDLKQSGSARATVWITILHLTMQTFPPGGHSMDALIGPALERMNRLRTLENT